MDLHEAFENVIRAAYRMAKLDPEGCDIELAKSVSVVQTFQEKYKESIEKMHYNIDNEDIIYENESSPPTPPSSPNTSEDTHPKHQKEKNKQDNLRVLKDSGINFSETNNGYTLLIREIEWLFVDFYPTTNKWRWNKSNYEGDAKKFIGWYNDLKNKAKSKSNIDIDLKKLMET